MKSGIRTKAAVVISLTTLSLAMTSGCLVGGALADAAPLPQSSPASPPNTFNEERYNSQLSQPVQSAQSAQGAQPYTLPLSATPAVDRNLPAPIPMVVTTTLSVDGYRIVQYKGIVRGSSVREPTIGQSFKAGFQGIFGGKVGAYVHMCEQGRQQSYDAMVAQAQALGANAIVGVKYDSNSFSTDQNQFATEVVCYGTAVVVQARPEQ